MELKSERTEDSRCYVFITLEEKDCKKEYQRVIQENQKKIKVNGFRPGKIPTSIIEEYYGKAELVLKTIELLSRPLVEKFIQDEKLELIATNSSIQQEIIGQRDPGSIEIGKEPIELKFTLELKPTFELPPYSGLKIELPIFAESSPEQLKTRKELSLHKLARTLVEWEDAPEGSLVEEGDQVILSYQGSLTKKNSSGEEFKEIGNFQEEERIFFAEEEDLFLEEGSRQLIGLKVGEKKSFETSVLAQEGLFPKGTFFEAAEGFERAIGSYEIEVTKIKKRKNSNLDLLTDLRQKLGQEGTQLLEKSVFESIQSYRASVLKERVTVFMIFKLMSNLELEIPEWLIKKEEEALKREEDKEEDKEEDGEENREEQDREKIINRLKVNLVLQEIWKKEKLSITTEGIEQEVMQGIYTLHQRTGYPSSKEEVTKVSEQIKEKVLNERTFKAIQEFLLGNNEMEPVLETPENLKEYKQQAKGLEKLGVYVM